jgi:hypothetical protein
MAKAERQGETAEETVSGSKAPAYEEWIGSLGVPIYRGYHIEDLRTVEVGWWKERRCGAAFMQLAGQEGMSEARLSEIPPGETTASWRMVLDEIVYVVEGRGLTSVWAEGRPKKTFEWQKHSLFIVPRGYHREFSNARGSNPARLLHYNSLPLAMSVNPDPEFFFKEPYADLDLLYGKNDGFYSEAKVMRRPGAEMHAFWLGNFFPDMKAWDRLSSFQRRGAGGHAVWIRYPKSPLWNHMSVFPSRTYKKAHRHGPGTFIVIPVGEGYSFMWPEGQEKVQIPWHEASLFVPPNRWFHQHFNAGAAPARYLAFHCPRGPLGTSEKVEDRAKDQIEYTDEDPIIRKTFESELGKRGITSLMPDEAYRDLNYEWKYAEGAE